MFFWYRWTQIYVHNIRLTLHAWPKDTYTHYTIFCVRREVFLPWMAGQVVILIARLSSFLSVPGYVPLSILFLIIVSHYHLQPHNAIPQGDPGKRKAQEQDNQQHVKSQMEGGDGPKLVKFYQHKRLKAPPCNYQVWGAWRLHRHRAVRPRRGGQGRQDGSGGDWLEGAE